MSTTTQTIYDAIKKVLQDSLVNYSVIPNPYEIENNPTIILKRGFGIAMGPGLNTQRYVGCISTWERVYTIVLVRQVINTQSDATGRSTMEARIDEDRNTVFKAFEANPTINQTVMKSTVTDDTGIQYLDGQLGKFLAIEMNLAVEYQETSTT